MNIKPNTKIVHKYNKEICTFVGWDIDVRGGFAKIINEYGEVRNVWWKSFEYFYEVVKDV